MGLQPHLPFNSFIAAQQKQMKIFIHEVILHQCHPNNNNHRRRHNAVLLLVRGGCGSSASHLKGSTLHLSSLLHLHLNTSCVCWLLQQLRRMPWNQRLLALIYGAGLSVSCGSVSPCRRRRPLDPRALPSPHHLTQHIMFMCTFMIHHLISSSSITTTTRR